MMEPVLRMDVRGASPLAGHVVPDAMKMAWFGGLLNGAA